MKTTLFFRSSPSLVLLFTILLMVPHSKLAAQDINRKLNVAVNGFTFDEAAAKKALLDGADINQKNDAMGNETLLIGAIKGFKESRVVKFLLDNGADASLKDNSGKTALDWATQYNFGRNDNGREILKLLGGKKDNPATPQNKPVKPIPQQNPPVANNAQNKTVAGGPAIATIKQVVEKKFTKDYEDHFYGVKNKVVFDWAGSIIVGQAENNRLAGGQRCYPVKLNVKVTITDPRDGNTSTITRGIEASIGGYHKTEIFCFYKNGFDEWEYGTYEQ